MNLFESYQGGSNCLLIDITFRDKPELNADSDELRGLACAAGLSIIEALQFTREVPDPKLFMGTGKADQIKEMVQSQGIDLVVFNHSVSPSQERNLELALGCKIVDRTRLILEIFSQRAQTHEGRLQVELAQLKYQSTRLVKGWTHLERQKGGIGVRGGPGEKQLELDKRMIQERIKSIEASLEKVKKQRQLGRSARSKSSVPTIAFVGYTNAGKSTLFNTITQSDVYVKDQLFATLDPTLRKVDIPKYGPVFFSDTVGFIKHLPHDLVEAFSATLEEAVQADLLLHVIDYSDRHYEAYIEQVHSVLKRIKADHKPMINIYNKIDLVDTDVITPHVDYDQQTNMPSNLWLSATKPEHMQYLYETIAHHFHQNWYTGQLIIPVNKAKVRAQLYQMGVVEAETINDSGDYILNVNIPRSDIISIIKNNNLELPRCFDGQ